MEPGREKVKKSPPGHRNPWTENQAGKRETQDVAGEVKEASKRCW